MLRNGQTCLNESLHRSRAPCPRNAQAVMVEAIVGVVMCWLDVSHYVIRARLCADHFNLLTLRCQAQLVDSLSRRVDSEQLEAIFRQYVARKGEAEARCPPDFRREGLP